MIGVLTQTPRQNRKKEKVDFDLVKMPSAGVAEKEDCD